MRGNEDTYGNRVALEASLERILNLMKSAGARKLYVKRLSPNDNSKNQPYFGSHLTDLPFIPTGDLVASATTSSKTKDPKRQIKYTTPLKLSWLGPGGEHFKAPHAKLIYYPQYPEVRFSGFLRGSDVDAGKWMDPYKQGRSKGRWLILGVCRDRSVLAYLATPDSRVSKELESTLTIEVSGVFEEFASKGAEKKRSPREQLISTLHGIYNEGWIRSQKLSSNGEPQPYRAQNGGGYTLESMLGISPNGIAEPDYLGWEVKQFGVTRFPTTGAKPTTLMTPEPNGGLYAEQGAELFVRKYGYEDKSGKPDRLNFGGKHNVGTKQSLTGLTLSLIGFDPENARITDANGAIALVDEREEIAASWSFTKLMDHWKKKHAQAVYIPCMRRSDRQLQIPLYHYGKDIELGTGTTFEMMLASMQTGQTFYDPGIKLEHASSAKPKLKRRSQFRVNHRNLKALYSKFEFIDVTSSEATEPSKNDTVVSPTLQGLL